MTKSQVDSHQDRGVAPLYPDASRSRWTIESRRPRRRGHGKGNEGARDKVSALHPHFAVQSALRLLLPEREENRAACDGRRFEPRSISFWTPRATISASPFREESRCSSSRDASGGRVCGRACPASTLVRYSVSTNGTLLTEEIAAFLEEHRFQTQLSFDGAARARICGRGEHFHSRSSSRPPAKEAFRLLRGESSDRRDGDALQPPISRAARSTIFSGKGVRDISITPNLVSDAAWRIGSHRRA